MSPLREAGSRDGYTGPLGTMFITSYESIILRVHNLKYKVLENKNYINSWIHLFFKPGTCTREKNELPISMTKKVDEVMLNSA